MVDHVDDYHGTPVADPYRWLEQDTAKAVAAWVAEENAVTNSYLARIPYREAVRKRLEQLVNYPRVSVPSQRRKYLITRRNTGLQNQPVVFIQEGPKGAPRVLIDPNTLSPDGTTSVGALVPSSNAKLTAYMVSTAGSDWQEIRLLETATGKPLGDKLRWVKVSGIAWWKDGFFYSRYDAPADTALARSGKNVNHKVYYHRIGEAQDEDELIYEDAAHPERFQTAETTEDERYLILNTSDRGTGKRGNAIAVRDLSRTERAFRPVIAGFEDEFNVVDNVGAKLLLYTNHSAPNWRVVLVDPDKSDETSWTTVLPEREEPLDQVSSAGGKVFAVCLKDVSHRAHVYDLGGTHEREIPLPGIGTIEGLRGERASRVVYYAFSSFTVPRTIYAYDIAAGASTLWYKVEVPYDPAAFEVQQVFYRSKDETPVPMFIVAKKGTPRNGNNPVLLYGYGGFNISLLPVPNPLLVAFLEQGGVYAQPSLRGGGEYGERWHEAGIKEKKQNVFDDFIGAAEWLIANAWTSADRMAMAGGSNGGLLVGVAMTQRPELFKVALPAVGVMDMLRFHQFTIGWNWVPDYGSSDDPDGFRYLRAYSPLHNLKAGVSYPATLVTTADHDDRVVPAHSFKFAATLQERNRGPNPVLIRIETRSGHGSSSLAKALAETADEYSFAMHNLGMTPNYGGTP
jgi:prolyl oligopeptidase